MLQKEKEAIIQQLRSISTPETERIIGEAISAICNLSEENKALLHSYEDCAARLQQASLENFNLKMQTEGNKKYKVYQISSAAHYTGAALVAAENAEKANAFINRFKESDKDNKCDSWGYYDVDEDDVIDGVFAEDDGIINYGISYCG